jgi:hypothetical protein
MRIREVSGMIILIGLLAAYSSAPVPEVESVTVDGKAVPFTVTRLAGQEVLTLAGHRLHLRAPRSHLNFSSLGSSLWLDGKCVAWENTPPAEANPGDAWGVWTRGRLEAVSPEAWIEVKSVEALPPNLKYVELPECTNPQILSSQSSLRYLACQAEDFDAIWLRAPKLQNLKLAVRHLRHPERLGTLQSLEVLALNAQDLKDVAALASCRQLRQFACEASSVEDLRPLAGLPQLESVSAAWTPLKELPDAVTWKHLDLLASQVRGQEAERFRVLNPDCEVWSDPNQPFHKVLAPSTRVVLRSESGIEEPKVLWQTRDRAEVHKLIDHLRVEERNESPKMLGILPEIAPPDREIACGLFQCMCGGGPTLKFYRGDSLLASINNQHGANLRWEEGPWIGDMPMTPECQRFFLDWLEARGCPEPKREQAKLEKPSALTQAASNSSESRARK